MAAMFSMLRFRGCIS